MPLFALISGYLFSASGKKYSFPELLKNKARSLALPALVWGVILFRTTAVRLLSGAGQISLQVYLVQRLLLERIAADCWISCTDRISNPLTQNMPVYDFLITPLIALSFYCVIFLLIRLIRPYRVPKLIFFGGC